MIRFENKRDVFGRAKSITFMILRKFWPVSFFLAGLLLTILAANIAGFADWHALHLYPLLAQGIGWISSVFPFSLAEVLIVVGGLVLLVLFVRSIVRILKQPGERTQRLVSLSSKLAALASIVYFCFVLLCGINYYRTPFSSYSGLTVQGSTKQELYGLCGALAKQANQLREAVPEENGVMTLNRSYQENAKTAQAALSALAQDYPVLNGAYGRPKPILLSKFYSYTQMSGVFIPFTAEANVNTDSPGHQLLATMCHELSHLRGFMREDEANFIAYLACTRSGDDSFAYSGTMSGLVHSLNQLYRADQDLWREIYGSLSQGVKNDISYANEYWARFEGPVSKASSSINNTYLQANNQADGEASYGRMVDLLLALYKKGEL